MWWRSVIIAALLVLAGAGVFHWRGARDYRPSPAAEATRPDDLALSSLHAGNPPPPPADAAANTAHERRGFDVTEGKRLYRWFNCVGCHANGGGDIGPPLMDEKWIYGSAPRNIYQAIVEGRPNGMPAFRGKIPEAQIWQIVAYVRSLSGQVPAHAVPGRPDSMQSHETESLLPRLPPQEGGSRPADPRSSR